MEQLTETTMSRRSCSRPYFLEGPSPIASDVLETSLIVLGRLAGCGGLSWQLRAIRGFGFLTPHFVCDDVAGKQGSRVFPLPKFLPRAISYQ
jgi:hypothetical protein